MLQNEISFKELYDAYGSMVYNIALNYVQHQQDAEDITQDVFVKVHQKLNTFRADAASFKTWIYRITINQSIDFLRAKKTNKRFGFITTLFSKESNEPLTEISSFNHPGVLLEDKEELQKVFGFINELTDNQKTALILTRLEDRSQSEVAEIMNMSIKAVESLLQRAKQSLLKKMNEA